MSCGSASVVAGLQHDHCLDRLAPARVGHGDDAGLVDGGVLVQQAFHLGRPDLVAADVDHALEAVAQEEVALGVHAGEVAGAEEALAVALEEAGGVGLAVAPVAQHHLGGAGDELAHLTRRQLGQCVRIDDA